MSCCKTRALTTPSLPPSPASVLLPHRESKGKHTMTILDALLCLGLAFFGLVLPWVWIAAKRAEREQQERIQQAYDFHPAETHGSARFSTLADLKKAGLLKPGGIRIGFSPDGKHRLYFNKAGHILIVAGARTGKAVTILVEAILSLPKKYSLCVFDPKGELCAICGHWRARFGDVYVLNPFGILLDAMKGLKQASFNPLSSLDPLSLGFYSACDRLADALCWEEGHETHWIISARLLISGVVAALVKYGSPADKTLVAVRNVITGASGRSVFDFCRECMALPDVYIRQKLARFAAARAEENKELQSVISTADSQTGFISGAIAESLKKSDFEWAGFRRKPGSTVFICLPLHELPVSKKYFRVLAASQISDTLADALNHPKGAPIVSILDEVSQIGPLKLLSDAWAMAAGAAGLTLMAVYQDVSQIRAQMQAWQTTIANSAVALYFGIRDPESSDFVSKQCGVCEVLSRARSVSIDIRSGEPIVNDSKTPQARPLLHGDEIRFGLGGDEMLLFADGLPGVCRAKRKPYFKVPGLKGYRANPYFQKPQGRLSAFLNWFFQ
jgi:type IV secretion system protein VirD4